jgi:hypothetical protein
MPLDFQVIVYGILLPSGLAAGMLTLLSNLQSDGTARRWPAAPAMGTSFIVGVWLFPWVPFSPIAHWHWLPYVALTGMAIGSIALWTRGSAGIRIVLYGLAGVATAWFLIPNWDDLRPSYSVYFAGLASGVLAVNVLTDRVARRLSDVRYATLLCVTASAGAVLLVLSGNLKLGQLTGVLAASTGGGAAAAWRRPSRVSMRSAWPVFNMLLCGLMLSGYLNSESDVPFLCYPLVVISPLTLWIRPPRKGGRRAIAIQTAGVVAPLAIALVVAVIRAS